MQSSPIQSRNVPGLGTKLQINKFSLKFKALKTRLSVEGGSDPEHLREFAFLKAGGPGHFPVSVKKCQPLHGLPPECPYILRSALLV